METKNLLMTILSGVWRVLDRLRRVMHFILLLVVFVGFLAALLSDRPSIPSSAALLLAPTGNLVDQLSGDPVERAIAKARGVPINETLLKDLIDAVEAAGDDDRISALVLSLDGLGGSGLSKLQELAAVITDFKESGKKVVAVGDFYGRDGYYLAAHADEIYMHGDGAVFTDGYARYRSFYAEAIDKLLIDWHVWRVGEYKSFVEPYTRTDMSPEDKASSAVWLTALWDAYDSDISAARGLEPMTMTRLIDRVVEAMRSVGGDAAKVALDAGLVDELLTRDEMRDRLMELVGADEDDEETWSKVHFSTYVRAMREEQGSQVTDENVGVIVASGGIVSGDQPPGAIGSESTVKLIRQARKDDSVKAIVLRVDSGGGSAFASNVILRELEQTQAAGKPVVVSMGSVAASGGYWISMSADQIWASPTTITGSIGILAMLPTFQRSFAKLGIYEDGVGTTRLSGQLSPMRELGSDANELLQLSIEFGYQQFISKVAAARDKTAEEIDAIARGRVWIGSDAHELGLVDRLGGLDQAVAGAAELAGLDEEHGVKYMQRELELSERIALELAQTAGDWIRWAGIGASPASPLRRVIDVIDEELIVFDRFNDPKGMYYYCFCDIQ